MTKEAIEDKVLGSIRGAGLGKTLSHTQLIAMAKMYLTSMMSIFNDILLTTEDKNRIINSVVERYEMLIGVIQPAPVVLEEHEPDKWFENIKSSLTFNYSERYFNFLLGNDFPDDTIKTIKSSTEKVLSYCANPRGSVHLSEQKKRGLVVGDVQSGKTSNYISLINMACDAGYKIIVLLAGMTSSLRQQTQDRIDEGFIGAKSDTINDGPEYIGVGFDSSQYFGIPLTNHTNDFVKFVKQNQNAGSEDYNKPVVLVVKKNKSILEGVAKWLKPGLNNISRKANILIIDDEADNASVNTKKDPNEMTAINAAIRLIYNNFPIASYVGYTATPFANIFINPFEEDPSNQDLFPSDFILLLETPSNYFGFEKVFEQNIEHKYKHIVRINTDDVNYLPTNHKKDVDYLGLTSDLEDAILHFYICNVIRTLDGKPTKHRSMLINISRFNDVQKEIIEKVEEYHQAFTCELEELDKKEDKYYFKSKKLKRLHDLFVLDSSYESARKKYDWFEIKNKLLSEVKLVLVKLVNNSVKNRFSYDDYKNEGARVIIVGGFVLSRGLTLEGLIISYYDRNSVAYDTLLQMCRWFGYRFGYEDLCKVYMTQESIDAFEAVYEAVTNLKTQFRQMAALKKKPRDFGLMVKESPDTLDTTLLVTSRNKMYSTKQVYCTLNYSGFAVDTSKIFRDKDKNIHNFNMVQNLFENIVADGCNITYGKRIFVNNVNCKYIADFINKIKVPFENTKFDQDSIVAYITSTDNQFLAWDVVVASGESHDKFELFPGKSVNAVQRSSEKTDLLFRISGNKNRLFEPSIFSSGLNEKIIEEVKHYVIEEVKQGRRKSQTPIAADYLNVRVNPLLVIYPVSLSTCEEEFEVSKYKNVILGFAVGFPGKNGGVLIKYRANKIKIDELYNRFVEIDDEEDDDND